MEIYKQIQSNPIYEISNKGNVRNSETLQILKATDHSRIDRKDPAIYLRIELKNPRKKYLIHRLVAAVFIINENNYDQINHKDKNTKNNCVENLEWCNTKQNCTHGQGVPVRQSSKDGNSIALFPSMSIAAEMTNSDIKLISAACAGKRNTHNNYKWSYA